MKLLDPKLVASERDVKWSDAAGMRDWLAHHYFDTSQAVVEATITEDLPPLEAAVLQFQARSNSPNSTTATSQVALGTTIAGLGASA